MYKFLLPRFCTHIQNFNSLLLYLYINLYFKFIPPYSDVQIFTLLLLYLCINFYFTSPCSVVQILLRCSCTYVQFFTSFCTCSYKQIFTSFLPVPIYKFLLHSPCSDAQNFTLLPLQCQCSYVPICTLFLPVPIYKFLLRS